jgi:predicted transcriptional regulator
MLAGQVARRKEIYCTIDAPLTKVFQLMVRHKCNSIPIVETMRHRNVIGEVSEHGICLKTIRDGLNPQRLSAGRVMNGQITTVSSEATLEECAEILNLTGAETLFVVGENYAFLGVLTSAELKFANLPHNPEKMINELPLAAARPPIAQMVH